MWNCMWDITNNNITNEFHSITLASWRVWEDFVQSVAGQWIVHGQLLGEREIELLAGDEEEGDEEEGEVGGRGGGEGEEKEKS